MLKLQKKRPKHLNLIEIKQPLPAVVSILHRVSGVLLFFPGIPILLCGLQMTLGSPQSYAEFQSFLANPLAKGASMLLMVRIASMAPMMIGSTYTPTWVFSIIIKDLLGRGK